MKTQINISTKRNNNLREIKMANKKKVSKSKVKKQATFLDVLTKIISDCLDSPSPNDFLDAVILDMTDNPNRNIEVYEDLYQALLFVRENLDDIELITGEEIDNEFPFDPKPTSEAENNAAEEYFSDVKDEFEKYFSRSVDKDRFVQMEFEEVKNIIDPNIELEVAHSKIIKNIIKDSTVEEVKRFERMRILGLHHYAFSVALERSRMATIVLNILKKYKEFLEQRLPIKDQKQKQSGFSPLSSIKKGVWEYLNAQLNDNTVTGEKWMEGNIFDNGKKKWLEKEGIKSLLYFLIQLYNREDPRFVRKSNLTSKAFIYKFASDNFVITNMKSEKDEPIVVDKDFQQTWRLRKLAALEKTPFHRNLENIFNKMRLLQG